MRTLVILPTYQEAENIEPFLAKVRGAMPEADILVADDNSPDGTGKLAGKAAADLGQIAVLHRPAKEGLGAAYRAGFEQGLRQGYDVVVQMDSDFSHDPAVLRRLVAAVADGGADCCIGSRYVPGGSTPNWPWYRRALSKYGNRYAAMMLSLGISDVTAGFRAYRADTLRTIHFETTQANGYAFQSELARRMTQAGLSMAETPITFVDRRFGTSKMSGRIIRESMVLVTAWGLKDHAGRLAGRLRGSRR